MSRTLELLDRDITTAETAAIYPSGGSLPIPPIDSLVVHANFDSGSGGTDVTAFVQFTFDGGSTWVDIACFNFTTSDAKRMFAIGNVSGHYKQTGDASSESVRIPEQVTPTDGTMTDNTALDGFIGTDARVKLTTTGTYTGANLKIHLTGRVDLHA